MKRLYLILTLIFLTQICVKAQDNDKPLRDTSKVMLFFYDTTKFYVYLLNPSPYLDKDNKLMLYPGEKVFLEVKHGGKKILSYKVVKENINPKNTITIVFLQIAENKKHKQMILAVDNPFDAELTYKAKVNYYESGDMIETDVWPVQPNGRGIETWPNIIRNIELREFEIK